MQTLTDAARRRNTELECRRIPGVVHAPALDIERLLTGDELAMVATAHGRDCACRTCVVRAIADASAWLADWLDRQQRLTPRQLLTNHARPIR